MLDLPPFPSYQIEEHLEELRRLGLSPPVIRLAMFDPPDLWFGLRCGDVGPPCPEWREQQPAGPPVSYLWCYRDTVTGAWLKDESTNLPGNRPRIVSWPVEFIKFKPNSPADGYLVIARSEQGPLANLFSDMIDDVYDEVQFYAADPEPSVSPEQFESFRLEELIRAAESVGFRYLRQIESFRRENRRRQLWDELLARYTYAIL